MPKGGEPAYRNGDQYKDTFGKRQGEMLAAHEQEYGYQLAALYSLPGRPRLVHQ